MSSAQDLKRTLRHMIQGVSSKRFTQLEQTRFEEDIRTVTSRLTSREYLQTSFKPRAQLSIPDRTEEIYKDLSFFYSVGQVWQQVLRRYRVVGAKKVLDIGTGYSPKVELGLLYAGFTGKLVMLDQETAATSHAKRFLRFFCCPFRYRSITQSILDSSRERYDLIVANHFLDDFGLSSHCQRNAIDSNEAYKSEKVYKALWSDIGKNPRDALSDASALATQLSRLLEPGGTIIFVDYKSFSHRAMQLTPVPRFVNRFRDVIRKELIIRGLKNRKPLSGELTSERLSVIGRDILCMSKLIQREAR